MMRTNLDMIQQMRQISTGKRLTNAEVDSAGFSIAAKLNARIRATDQALKNAGDAKSVLMIAEQSLTNIMDLLYTVKQKTLQAASATVGNIEREYIRSQINGYAREINDIVSQTEYNGVNLLDSNYDATYQVGEERSSTLSLALDQEVTVEDIQVSEVSTRGLLTAGGSMTPATRLSDTDQWSGIQAGDELTLELTRGDGVQQTLTLTMAGSKGQLTTTTIQDIIDAVNGTSDFQAVWNPTERAIDITETTPTYGNGLAAEFTTLNEFPGTDGASANLSFNFDASTGTLVSNFSSSDIEGQDQLTVSLRDRDGALASTVVTASGGAGTSSSITVNDIANSINTNLGADYSAVVSGGDVVVTETNLSQASLNATSLFTEHSLDEGAASLTDTVYNQTPANVLSDTLAGLNGADTLESTALGSNFDTGDTFDIQLTANDGSTQTITYTFGSPVDTVNQLLNYISANSNFTAALNGGQIEITEDTRSRGNSLDVSFQNFTDAALGDATFNGETFSVDEEILLSPSSVDLSGGATTQLNSLDEFTNIQVGDQVLLELTAADGSNLNFTYTFSSGTTGGLATDTVQDLINAINGVGGISSSFDSTNNAIVIQDTATTGNSLDFRILNSNFTEAPRPNNATVPAPDPFNFSYDGTGMASQVLQSGGVNAGLGTRLNDLDSFGNIEGQDQFQFTLRTRAGDSSTYTFNVTDVSEGTASNVTVGDIVSFLDGRTINGVQFSASLNAGQIEITEDNPPQRNFSGSSTFTENNIDITPKNYTPFNFVISEFLPLADDTGLVIGLGLLDFDAGNQLTQTVAQNLLQNVDDSITRIAGELNKLGNTQIQLSNRERMLQQTVQTNSAVLSRIEDANFAQTYSDYVRNVFVQFYQTTALAQANIAPFRVLDLL